MSDEEFRKLESHSADLVWMRQMNIMMNVAKAVVRAAADRKHGGPPPAGAPSSAAIERVLHILGLTSESDGTPASERAIRQLVTKTIQPSDVQLSCSVCLEVMAIGAVVTILSCHHNHVYHKECIVQVLRINNQCPLCRRSIPNGPASERAIAELTSRIATKRDRNDTCKVCQTRF